jgi:hypothetical protein
LKEFRKKSSVKSVALKKQITLIGSTIHTYIKRVTGGWRRRNGCR